MNFKMRIPQIGGTGPAGAQIVQTINVPPSPEDGNTGDIAVQLNDNGELFLHPKKTETGWVGTPRQMNGGKGDKGNPGNNGWSAVLAPEIFGDDLVFKVVNWIGGQGTKPAVGKYLGPAGLVDEPGNAVAYALVATAGGTAFESGGLPGVDDTNVQAALERLFARPAEYSDRIINGDFNIWQRGAGPFTSTGYTADRWRRTGTGGTVSVTRENFGLGTRLGTVAPRHFMRIAVSDQSDANHLAIMHQYIESVRSYAGETITLLGWMRRTAGAGSAFLEGVQNFGTGGSPSSAVQFPAVGGLSAGAIELGTGWAPFAVSFAVPNINGKVLGLNENDYMTFNFWLSAGSSFNARTNSLGLQTITADLWGVHIRKGVVPVSAANFYTPRHVSEEMFLSQRYYRQLAVRAVDDAAAMEANQFDIVPAMRIPPSISFNPNFGEGAQFLGGAAGFPIRQTAPHSSVSTGTLILDAEL